MKKLFTLPFILFVFFAKADYWTQKANITGGIRYTAVGFSIGSKGYIGTGYGTAFMQDFWEYDPVSNTWTQKANFPGAGRYFACGLSIGSKGYIGLGQDPGGYLQDFWAYDPLTNSWTQIANFAGGARGFTPTGFSVAGYGYVGLGFDGADKKDIWQYDTLLNTWTQKNNFGGVASEQAVSFTIGAKAYVGTGETSIPAFSNNDFWEYDPATDSWTQLTSFPGSTRFSAAAFSIGQFGYVGTGYTDSSFSFATDFYQYNIATDTWTQKAMFAGIPRSHDVSFSIGTKGYIGTGYSGGPGYLDDLWEYTPDTTTQIEDLPASAIEFTISPNPATELIVISYPPAPYLSGLNAKKNLEITISNVQGKKVSTKPLTTDNGQETIDIRNFSKGIYFVELTNGKQKAVKKFLKE